MDIYGDKTTPHIAHGKFMPKQSVNAQAAKKFKMDSGRPEDTGERG